MCIDLFTSNWWLCRPKAHSQTPFPLYFSTSLKIWDMDQGLNHLQYTRWPMHEGNACRNCSRSCWDSALSRLECQTLTFMFSYSKQPSFRAHQPPCHLHEVASLWFSSQTTHEWFHGDSRQWEAGLCWSMVSQRSCHCYFDFSFLRYPQSSLSSSQSTVRGRCPVAPRQSVGLRRVTSSGSGPFHLTAIKPGDQFTSFQVCLIRCYSQQVYHITSRYQIKRSLFGID